VQSCRNLEISKHPEISTVRFTNYHQISCKVEFANYLHHIK